MESTSWKPNVDKARGDSGANPRAKQPGTPPRRAACGAGSPAQRLGILLMNTGSPDAPTPEAVREYLAQFLMDDRIRPLPKPLWSIILHCFILGKRSVRSADKYRLIWDDETGSPLLAHARELAAKTQAALADEGIDATVLPAMAYGHPSVADALTQLNEAGCTHLVAVPLYPQSALSTTGALTDALEAALAAERERGWDAPCTVTPPYATHPLYIRAIADSIRAAGFGNRSATGARTHVVLSFHSIPISDTEKGDTYPDQARATADAVFAELGIVRDADDEDAAASSSAKPAGHLGFQSRFEDARAWVSPFTPEILKTVAQEGGHVLFACPGFSLDCLETIYDIDFEIEPAFVRACEDAGTAGCSSFSRIECLNGADAHARLMAAIVSEALRS